MIVLVVWVSGNGQTLFVTEKLKSYFKIQCLLFRGEDIGLIHIYRVACIQPFSCPYKDIGPLFFRIFLLPSVFRIYECLFMCFFPYKVFFFLVFLPHLYLGMSVYVFLFFSFHLLPFRSCREPWFLQFTVIFI